MEVCLIFSRYDGIIHDLIDILKFSIFHESTHVFPSKDDFLMKVTLESVIKKSIEKFELSYNEKIRSKLRSRNVKAVIFIATNDSIKSKKCIELLQLSKELKLPILTLIVEDIKNLEEIKLTILSDVDHHFEIYKDRVHATGYDKYMWIGESFQKFVYNMKHISNSIRFRDTNEHLTGYCFSYSLSNNTSPKNIGTFCETILDYYKNYTEYDLVEKLTDESLIMKHSVTEYFDYYEFLLRRADIDQNIENYAAIIRVFDNIVQNAKILKNIEPIKNEYISIFDNYGHIYRRIEHTLRYCKKSEEITSFLQEEMKKNGVDLILLNSFFCLLYQNHAIYDDFMSSKRILFLLKKEYYESKKFQKLYYEAKRMKKYIFLVKFEPFEVNIDDGYSHIYIHDVSKHENNAYEGYLTRRLLLDLSNCSKIENEGLEYKIWYGIFIYSKNDDNIESIQKMRKHFEEHKIQIKCKFDYFGNQDEINDDMEKSKVVLFCLTNDYLKSGEFQNDFNFVKKIKKPVLFLLMEEINSAVRDAVASTIDFQSLNVIEYFKMDNSTMVFKGEIFYRLSYFVISLLNIKQSRVSYEDGEVKLQPLDSIVSQKYSFKRGKLIKTMLKEYDDCCDFIDVAFIKHLNSYCFLEDKGHGYFYDHKFNYTHEFIHPNRAERSFRYIAVLYDDKNENVYLAYRLDYYLIYIAMLDNTMQFISKKIYTNEYEPGSQVILRNNYIFVINSVSSRVFNLNLEFLVELKFTDSIQCDQLLVESKCKNYVYMVSYEDGKINTFNTIGFNFNKNLILNHSFDYFNCLKFSNNLIFEYNELDENRNIGIWEIEYNNYGTPICRDLGDYVCQLNKYTPHLLKHPYLLPCGSLACLECIYENYNLYLNKFICAACDGEHQLKNQLERSTVIEDNLKRISQTQLSKLKQNLEYHAMNKHENLDNLFKFIEGNIEIRVESIKIKLDEHVETQIKFIDRLELELIAKCSRNSRKKAKNELKDFDLKKIIGQFPYSKILVKNQVGLLNNLDDKSDNKSL